MWDLPGPGIEPVSPVWAGGFLTTAPPGKSQEVCLFDVFHVYSGYVHLFIRCILQILSPGLWWYRSLLVISDVFVLMLKFLVICMLFWGIASVLKLEEQLYKHVL